VYLIDNGLHAPTFEDILAWKRELGDAGLSPFTRNLYLTAAKIFFKWTHRLGLYPNVTDGVKPVKKPNGKAKDVFSPDQLAALFAGIDTTTEAGKRDRAILAVMVCCGLRDCEVTRANVEHVTQATGVPVLRVFGKGRSGADEIQILTPPARDAIDAYVATRGKVDPAAPLFVSCSDRNRGGRLTPRSISRIVKQRAAAVGIRNPRLTAHSLRHSAITYAVQAGAPVQDVQEFARHADINTTLGYYHSANRLSGDAVEFKLVELLTSAGVFGSR
jgi:site-specific recombinase XerD